MQNSTPEEVRPSEFTLTLLRQVARCYNDAKELKRLNIH